jgi:hypothetical protein
MIAKPGPVVITCLPRAGATWLAYQFAACPGTTLWFEPCQEKLLDGTQESLQAAYERLGLGRSLRHPPRPEHYHTNYPLRPGGGLPLFRKRFCFRRYHLTRGASDEPFRRYLADLLERTPAGRRPVVKCNRSALRGRWLAHHFPGVYVYAFRDPERMDTSHFSFRGFSNPYVRDYALIVGQNGGDGLFRGLAEWAGLDDFAAGSVAEEFAHYRRLLHRGRAHRYGRQFYFDCLSFFWAVALAEATHYADIILDLGALADAGTRAVVERAVAKRAGLSIDLSGYRPPRRPSAPRHLSAPAAALTRAALARRRPQWRRPHAIVLSARSAEALGTLFHD